jgi:chemotaxis protein methyltransferase CheR
MTDGLLNEFSAFVAGHLGLHFPPERWPDLQRGIRAAAREFGYADEEACVRWLMSAPLTKLQIEVLAGNLTVGETYFFREPRTFAALEQQVLPELIRARRDGERRLRFWSAACCTGEEAYSLAILLRRLLPDWRDWNVTILATDVNPRFLHKAAQGVFGEWSFRDAPAWLRDGYFTKLEAKQYEILPELKRMVTFEHLNLALDVYPSLLNDTNAMDVIFCRNVLMYFASAQAQRVVAQLHQCLVDGGWLALSATETSVATSRQFTSVNCDGAILYRKCEQPPAPVMMPATPVVWDLPAVPVVEQPRLASPPPVAAAPEMIRLARELANQGRLADALVWADKLVAAEKLNAVAHYLRAMIVLEQGASAEAAKALHRAVYLDHNFVIAHFALGNLARNAGRRKEAEKHFTNVLHLLDRYGQDDLLPESEGMTAGRLAEIVNAMRDEVPVS